MESEESLQSYAFKRLHAILSESNNKESARKRWSVLLK